MKWKIDIKSSTQIAALLEDNNFDVEITSLLKDFKLSERWRDWIYMYVARNETNEKYDPDAGIIEQSAGDERDPITGEYFFAVRVYPDTTKRDMEHAWRVIQTLKEDGKKTRVKQSNKFERDNEIVKLRNLKMTYPEIRKKILAQFGDNLDAAHLKKIDHKFRKNAGMPAIPHRLKKRK